MLLDNIPKIIHLSYGRGTKLSYLQYLTVLSASKHNPDYTINIYYPKISSSNHISEIVVEDHTLYNGVCHFDKLKDVKNVNLVEFDYEGILKLGSNIPEANRSDFLRYYLLSTVGGIWSDFDILYFNGFDKMNVLCKDANYNIKTVMCFVNNTYHAIGLLMSAGNDELYKFLLNQSYANFNMQNYQSAGSTMINRLIGNPELVKARYPVIYNLERNLFYHQGYKKQAGDLDMEYIFEENYNTDSLIGVHWYNGHPYSKVLQNNFENYLNNHASSTFVKEIKCYG